MKFIWEDGHIKEFPVGTLLCGVQHNLQRPLYAEYTPEEVAFFKTKKGSAYYRRILAHICRRKIDAY